MTTETLDKIYLEYSNLTDAVTGKELKLRTENQFLAEENTEHCERIAKLNNEITRYGKAIAIERNDIEILNKIADVDQRTIEGLRVELVKCTEENESLDEENKALRKKYTTYDNLHKERPRELTKENNDDPDTNAMHELYRLTGECFTIADEYYNGHFFMSSKGVGYWLCSFGEFKDTIYASSDKGLLKALENLIKDHNTIRNKETKS